MNGTIYTARDAAHFRLIQCLEKQKPLPFDIEGQIIYYAGPTPAKPGWIIGSAGPTTSYRMDSYAPRLIELGLKGMIGKGQRSQNVIQAMKTFCAVYFVAVGGAGALISQCITNVEVIAYEDLGPEAIRRLEVKDFPVIVANDCHGGNLFRSGVDEFNKLTE